MVTIAKYHKNIDRVAMVIGAAMLEQLKRLPPNDTRHNLVESFFTLDKLNLYVKWYSPLSTPDLNAIIVNIGAVEFTDKTTTLQIAKTPYYVDFATKGDEDDESIDAYLYVAEIVRQYLQQTPKSFFQAELKSIVKLEPAPEKINDGTNNIIFARLEFEITTTEELSVINADFDFARINDTKLTVNNGTYKIFKEW
jgi:hypothetical protein